MIVVDTNVWSEVIRAVPDKRVRDWEALNSPLLWMSTVVLAEFRAGAALLPPGKRRDDLSKLIEEVAEAYSDKHLPFDDHCSREYGKVLLSARQAGMPIGTADAMIAATARANGMRIATRDLNDFAGSGVELIDPWNG